MAISLAGTIILCLPADCLFKTFRVPVLIGMLAVGAGFTAPLDAWAMDRAGPPCRDWMIRQAPLRVYMLEHLRRQLYVQGAVYRRTGNP